MHLLARRCALVVPLLMCSTVNAQPKGSEAELARFQGNWRISELVDDGTVVPAASVKVWLPSGGQVEIADNGLIFNSRLDGKKSVKTFSINPVTYPKQIVVVTHEKVQSRGIYKFDGGRLIVCLGVPELTAAPTDFSAPKGSRRMLMTLERQAAKPAATKLANLPPPPGNPAPAPRTTKPAPVPISTTPPPRSTPQPPANQGVSDLEVSNLLIGTWQMNDGTGLLNVTFNRDRSFQSYREMRDLRTFQSVFQVPVSSGVWSVQQGALTVHVASSTRLDRVNKNIWLAIRTISAKDLVYVDLLGRVGQAIKIR